MSLAIVVETQAATKSNVPMDDAFCRTATWSVKARQEGAQETERRNSDYTRPHELVQSSISTMRHKHASARAHKALRRQSVSYGTVEQRSRSRRNYVDRRLVEVGKDMANLTACIKRIEEQTARSQVHPLLLEASPGDPDYTGLS